MLTLILTNKKKYSTIEKAFNKIIKPNKLAVTVSFVPDKEIKRINKIYRQQNKVTDVLSFSYSESLGEILIAKKYQREVNKLIIHGLLHIVGYDHNNLKEAKKMSQKERQIIKLC